MIGKLEFTLGDEQRKTINELLKEKGLKHFKLTTDLYGELDVVQYEEYQKLEQEIDRLNNIINELERHLHQEILEWQDNNDNLIKAQVQEDKIILDKLKELKENNNGF